MSQDKPTIQIQNASSRVARSPSHESIEVSLLSLTSLGPPFARIPSPIHRLAVPSTSDGSKCSLFAEEENDLIKNFGALFKFLGSKSFSTSDINELASTEVVRKSSSELDLTHSDVIFRIPSRSCSTRVFVGDMPSSSQLPSPQGRLGSFTPADLVRTVNKKMRQLYIRKRLSVAYKLTQSGFDLVNLVPARATGGVTIPVPEPEAEAAGVRTPAKKTPAKELTLKDVERERGRPLSKLERNIFIFNWLHSLDETYEAVE